MVFVCPRCMCVHVATICHAAHAHSDCMYTYMYSYSTCSQSAIGDGRLYIYVHACTQQTSTKTFLTTGACSRTPNCSMESLSDVLLLDVCVFCLHRMNEFLYLCVTCCDGRRIQRKKLEARINGKLTRSVYSVLMHV